MASAFSERFPTEQEIDAAIASDDSLQAAQLELAEHEAQQMAAQDDHFYRQCYGETPTEIESVPATPNSAELPVAAPPSPQEAWEVIAVSDDSQGAALSEHADRPEQVASEMQAELASVIAQALVATRDMVLWLLEHSAARDMGDNAIAGDPRQRDRSRSPRLPRGALAAASPFAGAYSGETPEDIESPSRYNEWLARNRHPVLNEGEDPQSESPPPAWMRL